MTAVEYVWVTAGGAPGPHLVRAAARTASLIDGQGSTIRSTRHSYTRHPSEGLFPVEDLRRGEQLLLDCGLVREEGGVLYPAVELSDLVQAETSVCEEVLLAQALILAAPEWLVDAPFGSLDVPAEAQDAIAAIIPDPERREAFLLALGGSDDLERRAELGSLGEEAVVEFARRELLDLNRQDLAAAVRRVSLYSDKLGYDVTAPKVTGETRRIEVKTTQLELTTSARFFLSRNEAEVGLRDDGWSLVVCAASGDDVRIAGWCPGRSLGPYLPADTAAGRWTEARLTLPLHLLFPDIPPAT